MASKKEVWLPIDENTRYEISSKKRVRNAETGKVLAIDAHNAVTLCACGYKQHMSVNSLYSRAF